MGDTESLYLKLKGQILYPLLKSFLKQNTFCYYWQFCLSKESSIWPKILMMVLKRLCNLQVLFRQEGQSNSQVIETQKTSAVVLLPDVGVYIIEVCAVSEGGDGTVSSQIRVPSFSGRSLIFCIQNVMVFKITSSFLLSKCCLN